MSHESTASSPHVNHDIWYYCPVYGDIISSYACNEIAFAAKRGWILNDGLPPLMDIKDIKPKAYLCVDCPHNNLEKR